MRPHLAAATLALTLSPAAARADRAPELSVYGFARLDILIDDSAMSDAQTPYFVLSEPDGANDGDFSMHPRLSRIGLTADDWELSDHTDAEGTVEIDFQSGADDPGVRLRHAHFELVYRHDLELLAGQTWDLISPLFPSVGNDTLMANAGNTGDRRTQLRLTAMPTDRTRVAVALAPSGAIDHQDIDGNGVVDGLASGEPMVQGLIEYRMRLRGSEPSRFGVWGHIGSEQFANQRRVSRSVGAHMYLPLGRTATLLGEVFFGRNLDDLRGGIGQGVDPGTWRGVDAAGGWLELALVFDEKHMVSFGYTVDSADEEDLSDGGRTRNSTGYGVYRYRPVESLQLGFEFLGWFTRYKNGDDGEASRLNVHVTAFF